MKNKNQMENKEGIYKDLELIYTEEKWENVIDRKTSEAKHPDKLNGYQQEQV